MKNKLLPLPAALTDEAKTYISDELKTELAHEPEVIFIAHEAPDNNANDIGIRQIPWIIARMREAGFSPTVQKPNRYWVIVFHRGQT
jgi:hypothetical protein